MFRYILCCILLMSCSHKVEIGKKELTIGQTPKKIIWIQVPGLMEEHLAMLRFHHVDGKYRSAFEESNCFGKSWNYNLYQLRPSANEGTLSQILGTKNVKNDCSDYKSDHLFKLAQINGYQVDVFEREVGKKNSLLNLYECEKGEKGKFSFWIMSKAWQKDVEFFHHLNNEKIEHGKTFFDRSCQQEGCFSGLFENVRSIWKNKISKSTKGIFVIRDFSYLKVLRTRNIPKAREVLKEVEKIYQFFSQDEFSGLNLVLFSSTAGVKMELPKKGMQWKEFEKNGRFAVYKNQSLISPVFATGAASENFCGMYEESKILNRVFDNSKSTYLNIGI